MNTEILLVHPHSPQQTIVAHAAEILRCGGLVAFPTETVYGLGANALDPAAVQRIYTAKGRPSNNPLIVHVASIDAARELTTDWPANAQLLAERFWPGPLTIILPKAAAVPDLVTGGGPTIALRIPRHPVALALLAAVKLPIAAPSANRSTELSSTKADHVLNNLGGRIEMILDGGPTPGGLESTVVDLSGSIPTLLRPGLISPHDLRQVLPELQLASHLRHDEHLTTKDPETNDEQTTAPLISPGLMSKHYSPRAKLECWALDGWRRVQELLDDGAGIGWLRWGHHTNLKHPRLKVLDMPVGSAEYGSCLYAKLHDMDDFKVTHIVLDLPPDEEHWLAIRDRLRRASSVWNEPLATT
jgi:L-threonylcarbamoyladenylate synthase